ncbi:uncharacterized protein STEHIDRAFT_92166 [Stereum hirsutum FP-91666 SS1]|uniref:uncharacterized protein n=1 Tax=Stereum hirsutum (strain FP-91666) TaxID=721885 RepID=UPI000440BCF1|nr:uncharacterized protein STEHIDRAFT_92166 [Stereum hirsutum FP-91666 SS1]EIM89722.1 hypothetical protein STEHIDRAFT_92166 [Stereum hirsutum FP-91666 SS1]
MAVLPALRIFLYCCLLVFSIVLLGLSAARLHYTRHLSPFDPLNSGTPFTDPIVVEILVTTILTILWVPYVLHAIIKRREGGFIWTFFHELIALFVLFVLWIVGAAIATSTSNPPNHQSHWGALSWCQQFQPCRILTALVAFVWMGWIMVVFLMFASILFCIANRAWGEPMHGRVYPRDSTVYPQTTQYRASRTA